MRDRREAFDRLYAALDQNVRKRPMRELRAVDSLYSDPSLNRAGLYFFFESGEFRENGKQLRVTRVGKANRLWQRLKDHSYNSDRSIFLGYVFSAMVRKKGKVEFEPWLGKWWSQIREDGLYVAMREFEREVVLPYIGSCLFTFVPVSDEASARKLIVWERGAISLLSNRSAQDGAIDSPSPSWLGRHSPNLLIQTSGLWNVRHVDHLWTDDWLDGFEQLIANICGDRQI